MEVAATIVKAVTPQVATTAAAADAVAATVVTVADTVVTVAATVVTVVDPANAAATARRTRDGLHLNRAPHVSVVDMAATVVATVAATAVVVAAVTAVAVE